METTTYEMSFPKAGIDLSGPFGVQKPREVQKGLYGRSTPVAKNVRVFSGSDISRGGSRPGLSRLISTPVVAEWMNQELNVIVTTGEPVQANTSGRVPFLVAVSQGNVYYARAGETEWTAAINLTGDDPPLNFVGLVRSAPNNQLLFFVDGTNYCYFEPATLSVKRWEATDGQMPADLDNNFARLICTWRGRTTVSGLFKDDQNICFAKVGEPFNFNYFPEVIDKTIAVALNAAPQGLVGDSVQTLIPFSDDLLLIGCANSLFMLAGDPADGGELDRVSSTLGTAWGQPWVMGPNGTIYFVASRGGIWAMQPSPGARPTPQRVSQGIEEYIRELDMGNTGIRLGYEPQDQCIHVFLSPLTEPAATQHLTLDLRTMGWSTLVFKNKNHDPLCMTDFDGNTPGERKLILGSWDGYARAFDRDAERDDGTIIESEVILGGAPLITKDMDEVMLHDVQIILGKDSGDVDYDILSGPTAEAALVSDPVVSGTFTASDGTLGGRDFTDRIRVAAHAIYFRLKSTVRWSMETVRCRISTLGSVRQRGS